MRPNIGEISGCAGKKLGELERRCVDAERRVRDLDRERQAAGQEAARLDSELVAIEGRAEVGMDVGREAAAKRKELDAARKRGDRIDDRTLAVANEGVKAMSAAWLAHITDHAPALKGAVSATSQEHQDALTRELKAVVERIEACRQHEALMVRLAGALPGSSGQDVRIAPQAFVDLRRAARIVLELGVPVAVLTDPAARPVTHLSPDTLKGLAMMDDAA